MLVILPPSAPAAKSLGITCRTRIFLRNFYTGYIVRPRLLTDEGSISLAQAHQSGRDSQFCIANCQRIPMIHGTFSVSPTRIFRVSFTTTGQADETVSSQQHNHAKFVI